MLVWISSLIKGLLQVNKEATDLWKDIKEEFINNEKGWLDWNDENLHLTLSAEVIKELFVYKETVQSGVEKGIWGKINGHKDNCCLYKQCLYSDWDIYVYCNVCLLMKYMSEGGINATLCSSEKKSFIFKGKGMMWTVL